MPRLEEPRAGYAIEERADAIVVEDRNEIRNEQPALLGLHAHRELVAEEAHGTLAHSGHAHVLAERRRHFEIELVQRDDSVDRFGTSEPAHAVDHVITARQIGDEQQLVDTVARPLQITQRFSGNQQHACAEPVALANEVVALEVAGETEDRDGRTGHVSGGGVRRHQGL